MCELDMNTRSVSHVHGASFSAAIRRNNVMVIAASRRTPSSHGVGAAVRQTKYGLAMMCV